MKRKHKYIIFILSLICSTCSGFNRAFTPDWQPDSSSSPPWKPSALSEQEEQRPKESGHDHKRHEQAVFQFATLMSLSSYADNPTIPVIAIAILAAGICFIIFACITRWDKCDRALVREIFPSHDKQGKHPYFITIATSSRPGAGIKTGQVGFTIKGSSGNTQKIIIAAENIKGSRPFTSGCVKSFIYYSPIELNDLMKIELELEADGDRITWYLNYIAVVELSKRKQWYFPCFDWIRATPGHSDCRSLTIVDEKRKGLFMENLRRGIQEYHLWVAPWCSREIFNRKIHMMYIGLMFFALCTLMFTHTLVYHIPSMRTLNEKHPILCLFILYIVAFLVIGTLQIIVKYTRTLNETEKKNLNIAQQTLDSVDIPGYPTGDDKSTGCVVGKNSSSDNISTCDQKRCSTESAGVDAPINSKIDNNSSVTERGPEINNQIIEQSTPLLPKSIRFSTISTASDKGGRSAPDYGPIDSKVDDNLGFTIHTNETNDPRSQQSTPLISKSDRFSKKFIADDKGERSTIGYSPIDNKINDHSGFTLYTNEKNIGGEHSTFLTPKSNQFRSSLLIDDQRARSTTGYGSTDSKIYENAADTVDRNDTNYPEFEPSTFLISKSDRFKSIRLTDDHSGRSTTGYGSIDSTTNDIAGENLRGSETSYKGSENSTSLISKTDQFRSSRVLDDQRARSTTGYSSIDNEIYDTSGFTIHTNETNDPRSQQSTPLISKSDRFSKKFITDDQVERSTTGYGSFNSQYNDREGEMSTPLIPKSNEFNSQLISIGGHSPTPIIRFTDSNNNNNIDLTVLQNKSNNREDVSDKLRIDGEISEARSFVEFIDQKNKTDNISGNDESAEVENYTTEIEAEEFNILPVQTTADAGLGKKLINEIERYLHLKHMKLYQMPQKLTVSIEDGKVDIVIDFYFQQLIYALSKSACEASFDFDRIMNDLVQMRLIPHNWNNCPVPDYSTFSKLVNDMQSTINPSSKTAFHRIHNQMAEELNSTSTDNVALAGEYIADGNTNSCNTYGKCKESDRPIGKIVASIGTSGDDASDNEMETDVLTLRPSVPCMNLSKQFSEPSDDIAEKLKQLSIKRQRASFHRMNDLNLIPSNSKKIVNAAHQTDRYKKGSVTGWQHFNRELWSNKSKEMLIKPDKKNSNETVHSTISYSSLRSSYSKRSFTTDEKIPETWDRCWNQIKNPVESTTETSKKCPDKKVIAAYTDLLATELTQSLNTQDHITTLEKSVENITHMLRKKSNEQLSMRTSSTILNINNSAISSSPSNKHSNGHNAGDITFRDIIDGRDFEAKSDTEICTDAPSSSSNMTNMADVEKQYQLGALAKQLSFSITSRALANALSSLEKCAEKRADVGFQHITDFARVDENHSVEQPIYGIRQKSSSEITTNIDENTAVQISNEYNENSFVISAKSSTNNVPHRRTDSFSSAVIRPSSEIMTAIDESIAGRISSDNIVKSTCATIKNVYSEEVLSRVEEAVSSYGDIKITEFSTQIVSSLFSQMSAKLQESVCRRLIDCPDADVQDLIDDADKELREKVIPNTVQHVIHSIDKEAGSVEDFDVDLMRMVYAGHYIETIVTNAVMQTHVIISRELSCAKHITSTFDEDNKEVQMPIEADKYPKGWWRNYLPENSNNSNVNDVIEKNGTLSKMSQFQTVILKHILERVQSMSRDQRAYVGNSNERNALIMKLMQQSSDSMAGRYLVYRTLKKAQDNLKKCTDMIDEHRDSYDVNDLIALGRALLNGTTAAEHFVILEKVTNDVQNMAIGEAIRQVADEFFQDKIIFSEVNDLKAMMYQLHSASRGSSEDFVMRMSIQRTLAKQFARNCEFKSAMNTNSNALTDEDFVDYENIIRTQFHEIQKNFNKISDQHKPESFERQDVLEPVSLLGNEYTSIPKQARSATHVLDDPMKKPESFEEKNVRETFNMIGDENTSTSKQTMNTEDPMKKPESLKKDYSILKVNLHDYKDCVVEVTENLKSTSSEQPVNTEQDKPKSEENKIGAFVYDYLRQKRLHCCFALFITIITFTLGLSFLAASVILGETLTPKQTKFWLYMYIACLAIHGLVIETIKAFISAVYWTSRKNIMY